MILTTLDYLTKILYSFDLTAVSRPNTLLSFFGSLLQAAHERFLYIHFADFSLTLLISFSIWKLQC